MLLRNADGPSRLFDGEDITDTIVSVVSKEPDWTCAAAATCRRVFADLLARCLKKDPKPRLRDIGEARVQIEELIGGAPDDSRRGRDRRRDSPVAQSRSASSRALPWCWPPRRRARVVGAAVGAVARRAGADNGASHCD